MRVLVTGGAGYIGCHAAQRFARLGHQVSAFDNLCRGHAAAAVSGRLIVGELTDTAALEEALVQHGIQAVVHFAALTNVGESVTNPAIYYRNNVVGTLSLLEAMRRARVNR